MCVQSYVALMCVCAGGKPLRTSIPAGAKLSACSSADDVLDSHTLTNSRSSKRTTGQQTVPALQKKKAK